MNIHEYQAKQLLRQHGIDIPRGVLCHDTDEALAAAKELGGKVWVVKAQIHAGGRGKAGGVRLCRSAAEVEQAAAELIGSRLITPQTGKSGKQVHKVYVEEGLDIANEYYLSLLVDRDRECLSFVLSPDGGMSIEEVAASHPDRIRTQPIAFDIGPTSGDCREMADFLGLPESVHGPFEQLIGKLYAMFTERDASLIELNPLALTRSQQLLPIDAKFVADDNALFRQPEILAMRDPDEEDPREAEAAQFGLNYIALDGNIGCMVNGAGLAMATMDIIQLKGGQPANFLDVGGGVTVDAVAEGFRLLLSDPHISAILVNIFGGIVRCDIIAMGLLQATQGREVKIPIIMRLVGTNEEEGRRMIRESGVAVHWADDLDKAAELAISLSNKAEKTAG